MDYFGAYTIHFKYNKGDSDGLTVTNLKDNSKIDILGPSLVKDVKWTGLIPIEVSSVKPTQASATKSALAELIVESNGKPFFVVFTKANGESRSMHCHLVSSERLLGHALVFDYEANDFRQVDLRTVKHLIIDNVHYTLKG